jgi:uncharacterized protein YbjQ (UPF0145 family)
MSPPGNAAASGSGRRAAEPNGPFGSALTVAEFALLQNAGVAPLAAVMGCNIRWFSMLLPMPALRPPGRRTWQYNVGLYKGNRYEHDVVAVSDLDAAETKARHAALDQLRAEALELGANAVIGVRRLPGNVSQDRAPRSSRRWQALGASPSVTRQITHQIVGTAVRDPANRRRELRLSALSGSDFWKLRCAGWEPVGIVGGCSHQFGSNVWVNYAVRELQGVTAIWSSARAAALDQLWAEFAELSADGVVGLSFETHHETIKLFRQDHPGVLVSTTVTATAIRRAVKPAPTPLTPMRIIAVR